MSNTLEKTIKTTNLPFSARYLTQTGQGKDYDFKLGTRNFALELKTMDTLDSVHCTIGPIEKDRVSH